MLAGLPHALEYAPDPASGASRLALVTIGRDLGGGMIAATAPAAAKARRHVAEASPEEAEARAERAQQLWKTSLENLESNDPELRADGARWMSYEELDRVRVIEVSAHLRLGM